MLLAYEMDNDGESGTTLLSLLIQQDIENNKIYICCENVGDSIGILSHEGKPIIMSEIHRLTNEIEKKRVLEKNGVIANDRLFLSLALSRALGDLPYKRKNDEIIYDGCLSSTPFIFEKDINDDVLLHLYIG